MGGQHGTLSQTGAGEWVSSGLIGNFPIAGARSGQESNGGHASGLSSIADGIQETGPMGAERRARPHQPDNRGENPECHEAGQDGARGFAGAPGTTNG